VNHETISLGGILRQAGLWGKIEARYAPLPIPDWQRPKVFTAEEQEAIFEAAKSDPDLDLADIVFTSPDQGSPRADGHQAPKSTSMASSALHRDA
jgi:hypothetical protein